MVTNPMHQFEVYKIGPEINLGTVNLSFTNASLFMFISSAAGMAVGVRVKSTRLGAIPAGLAWSTKGDMIWKRHMIAGFLVRLDFLVSLVSWDPLGPTVINIWPDSHGLPACRWLHSWS